MEKISVVISARNEEAKLARCLTSLRQFADEIIVIDNESTDKTLTIARAYTSHIYKKKNTSMLNVNKNFGFTKATGDWVFSIDGDEEVPAELAQEIKEKVVSPQVVGYWTPRRNIIFGKWITHGLWWPDKQLRLFRRGRGKFPCRHVHEYLEVDGQTGQLTNSITHYNYETISQFIQKMDTIYTVSEVQKLIDTNYQLAWYDGFRFPVSDFVKIYFAQEGYKDGLHGLVLSMLQAFYSFIVFAKLWERQKFYHIDVPIGEIARELDRDAKEVRYWSATSRIEESQSVVSKLWLKLLRHYGAH